MSVQPSGFRPPFDESRIHGDMAFIRSQVAQKLINEDAQAKGIVEMHAHEAIGFSDDPEAFNQITSNAQAEVDQLFAGKEEEIETFLKTQLPASEVKPVLEQLREEWHNEHNVNQNALGLVAEKERKALPTPEDVFRATSQPKVTPPSAGPTAGAGAPGASGANLPPWINDLIKKLFERYKEQSVVDQLVGAFTKGSPPSPELINLLNAWNSAPLLGKSGLYEQIKLALSGGAEEKKGVEKAAPKKEEAAPLPKAQGLFGAEGGEKIGGIGAAGVGATSGEAQAVHNELFDAITSVMQNNGFKNAIIADLRTKWNVQKISEKPLSEQIAFIKSWGKEIYPSSQFYKELDDKQKLLFEILVLNPRSSQETVPIVKDFSEYLEKMISWGIGSTPKGDLIAKLFNAIYDSVGSVFMADRPLGYVPYLILRSDDFKRFFNPLIYANFPGLSDKDLTSFLDFFRIQKLEPVPPVPAPTPFDQFIMQIYEWSENAPVQDQEFCKKVLALAADFRKQNKSIEEFSREALIRIEMNGVLYDSFQRATDLTKVQFLVFCGVTGPLMDSWKTVLNWRTSAKGSELDLANLIFKEITKELATGKRDRVDLQKWFEDRYSKEDVFWQYKLRDPTNIIQKLLSNILGKNIEGISAMDNTYLDVIDQLEKFSGNDRIFWQSFLDLFKQLNSRSTIPDLNNLAKNLIGSEAYKKASFNTIWLFLDKAGFPAGELKALYQKAADWLKNTAPGSRERDIAEKLLQGIMSLVPYKGFSDLQKWAVQFIRSDLNNFFAMKPGDQAIFFNITGTLLEGIRFNLREWAKNDGEAKLLTEINKLIDSLENGAQPAPDLNKLVGRINTYIIEHPAIYFECFGLTDDGITRLAEFLKVKIDLPKTNDMDKILLTAWKFNPGADGSFWETFKNQIKTVGHGGDRTQLQDWARDYIVKNFGAFSQFSSATQLEFMNLTGTLLEPTRAKLMLWIHSIAPNEIDPVRTFINAIAAQIDSLEKNKFNCTTEDLLNALKIDVLGPGKDLYYIYAGMTDVQLQQIGNILGINLALPSDMDRVIFESYRYMSNSESGKRLFSELIKFLKEHPESQTWSFNRPGGREEFNTKLTLLFFLNNPVEFWRNYSSFSAQDIAKFKEITGLDIPQIPPDPFPFILDEIKNYIRDLQRLLDVLNAYASLYHTKPPQSWNDKDWKLALTVIGNPKNSGKFFTSKADRDKVLGMLHSRQNYSQIASALQLFTSARDEIMNLQKVHGTAEDLRKWADRQDISRLSSPQDQAEFNKLKQFKG